MPIIHQTSEPTVFDRTYLILRPESVPLISSVNPFTDTRLPGQFFDLGRIDADARPHGR